MQERRLQTQEVVNLHEQGGLTPAHWQDVINRIGQGQWRIDECVIKIVAYAQKVISGEFPDTGFHHREYLGYRHWSYIAILDTRDEIKTPRKFPPWPKTTWVKNPLPQDIREFARSEKEIPSNLNDYIYETLSSGHIYLFDYNKDRRPGETGFRSLIWNESERMWKTKINITYDIYYESYDTSDEGTTIFEDSIDIDALLSRFLLTKEEVADPQQTPPQNMRLMLINAVKLNPGKIQNRLRSLKSYQFKARTPPLMFGRLEKEI